VCTGKEEQAEEEAGKTAEDNKEDEEGQEKTQRQRDDEEDEEEERHEKKKRQDLAEKHQASEDEARLAQLQEGEQVHALVLSLLQQCVDPAIVTPHAAQRLHVAQHPTNHPWDACSNACV